MRHNAITYIKQWWTEHNKVTFRRLIDSARIHWRIVFLRSKHLSILFYYVSLTDQTLHNRLAKHKPKYVYRFTVSQTFHTFMSSCCNSNLHSHAWFSNPTSLMYIYFVSELQPRKKSKNKNNNWRDTCASRVNIRPRASAVSNASGPRQYTVRFNLLTRVVTFTHIVFTGCAWKTGNFETILKSKTIIYTYIYFHVLMLKTKSIS